MILWILAVAGSALVLTQSSLTEPLRNWLTNSSHQAIATRELRASYERERKLHPDIPTIRSVPMIRAWSHVSPSLAKLISCPMCSGFWLGMAWAWYLINRGELPPIVGAAWSYGFAGSIVSAIGVALWLALSEAQAVSYLWRTKNSGSSPKMRVPLKMRPAYINNTNTVFSCNCGEPVCAGCSHFLTERCGEDATELSGDGE